MESLLLQCDSNMNVYTVWVNNLDPRMPRLAFFASRDICRLEELTFDYKITGESEEPRVHPGILRADKGWHLQRSSRLCVPLETS